MGAAIAASQCLPICLPSAQGRLRRLLGQPLCGLQLILVGDFLQVCGLGLVCCIGRCAITRFAWCSMQALACSLQRILRGITTA